MADLATRLAQTQAFGKLRKSECVELASVASYRRLEAGEFLCHQGQVWPRFVYLAAGQLQWVLLSVSGKEYVVAELKPAAIFWGHSFFDDQPMPACLQATNVSEVYEWSRAVAQPILLRNPTALWEITKDLVRMMRRSREIIYGLAFQPVAGRLAHLLLNQFPAEENPSIERSVTLSEIASRIATSPEVVSRLLHQFESEGIVEINRASITLSDRSALEQLANSQDKWKRE